MATTIGEYLTELGVKLNTRLSNINAKLTAKGSTEASDLDDVPAKIEAIQVNVGNDTADATAYAEDILYGKTAYARGSKVTGTHICATNTSDYQTQIDIINSIIGG